MKKLSILDKSVKLTNKRFNVFTDWSRYETQVFNGMVTEVAPIHRMLICKPVWNLKSHIETYTGEGGYTNNVTVVCLVLFDGRVMKVYPSEHTHGSNYAYEKTYTYEGITVANFMSVHEIKPEQVKFIVEVVQCYSEWNETERKRSVTIYGRKFKPSTVLNSFKEIYGQDPWLISTVPTTLMASNDRLKVRETMKFVFGPEMAQKLFNFIRYGKW